MLHRIRLTMQDDSMEKIGGNVTPVEMDETFIRGKVKNMHKVKKPIAATEAVASLVKPS